MEAVLFLGLLIAILVAGYSRTRRVFPLAARIIEFPLRTLCAAVSSGYRKETEKFKPKTGCILLDHVRVPPQRFYHLLEVAIHRRSIPGFLHPTRITRREGSIFQCKRECLRLAHDAFVFDVCAAPYGSGFFVSWRLRLMPITWSSCILVVPALLHLTRRALRPRTEDQHDQFFLFQEAALRSLQEVIEQIAGTKSVRPTTAPIPSAQFRGNYQP